jgi:hypothetical protein
VKARVELAAAIAQTVNGEIAIWGFSAALDYQLAESTADVLANVLSYPTAPPFYRSGFHLIYSS